MTIWGRSRSKSYTKIGLQRNDRRALTSHQKLALKVHNVFVANAMTMLFVQ